ncbi:MAG: cytosine permease [Thermosediminibacterales bacterium]|nr:cytosine permease [Thermosediminibacterales bacterium]MDK2836218.1 cytosine permease [Thermosediminibacterales bacterium]
MAEISNDYALGRTPQEARKPMWDVFMVRFGAVATLSQFILGATLGYGMTLKQAMIATFLGSILLEIVSLLIGIAGAREGMSTSFLTRWTGFGKVGSSLIGLIIAISCIGWFGIQNAVFAEGLIKAFGGNVSFKLMSFITGMAITIIVVFGYKMISWTAKIAVPGFLLAVAYATYKMLSEHNLIELLNSSPPGEPLNIGVAITMVAGGFMVGAIVTPDLSRYNRNAKDVFWMTFLSIFLGEILINLIAVLMAHAVKSSDVVSIMLDLGGWFAALLVVFATIKINDINLYAASLGVTNFLDAMFGIKANRGLMTLIIGALGTFMSTIGILDNFVGFLVVLGIAVPPVGGIMVVDYYILRRHRKVLDETRASGKLPERFEKVNPLSLLAWAGGFLVGYFIKSGIPSLNSLIASAVLYYVLMKLYAVATNREVVEFEQVETI